MGEIIALYTRRKILRINRDHMPDEKKLFLPGQMIAIYGIGDEVVVCTLSLFVECNALTDLEYLFLCRKLRHLGFAMFGGGAAGLYRVELAP